METVTFTAEDGVRLEGEIREPDARPRGVAVLCHPHPRHGGSKDHPLLWAIRNDLAAARGVAVLGFNFRGVMGSQGSYGGGRDELRDVRAAVTTLLDRAGEDVPVFVVGWSFGASVALRAALDDRRIGAVALVGFPLRPGDLSLPPLPDVADLRALRRPALLLAGEHDAYCPPEELDTFGAGFPDATVTVVPGTDHYFWRREGEAAEAVGSFAERRLLT
ncbi:MAG TPA: alpha/beta fold hydrolase [Actinomycetota bacterium]|nr:alpha/beta fold hydrolase [Actinomycetota bacterium]